MVCSSGGCSGRHRGSANRSTELQNLILRLRRARRVFRPHTVVFIRFFIILFTIVELKPTQQHFDHEIFAFASRLNILVGIMAGIFSIIYFDVKVFNVATVACMFVKFLQDCHLRNGESIAQLLAWATFHASAILFSMHVGRRRSIVKPMLAKGNGSSLGEFSAMTIKNLRNVDVVEAGVRLQAAILAVDHAMSLRVGATGFMFTLPFAILFVAGYSLQKNGIITLMLLVAYAVMNESSPVLGFGLVKTMSTVSAAVLALLVGPGGLAVDEWIARSRQLCY